MQEQQLMYRQADQNDLEGILELALLSYGQYESVLLPEHWQTMKSRISNPAMFAELIDKARSFVCVSGKKIVGMIFIVPSGGEPFFVFEAGWSYIRMAGVHPGFSGKGIAKELTRLCIDFTKANNEKTIALHTSEMMSAARHIYESQGFRQIKEIDALFGKRYWLYRLDLVVE